MKKRSLNKAEIKELNEKIHYGYELPVKNRVEMIEDKPNIILVESEPVAFEYEGKVLPTLKSLQEKQVLKKITVDMGAVKFVASGADIMRPGIVAIEDGIAAGDGVVIVDQNFGKLLAVGIALFSSEEMKAMAKGKVIKNLHYVGDKIWNFGKE